MNPSSESQAAVRTAFGGWSPSWRALTQAQRDAWTALGLQMTRTDSLGQTYSLTGLQAYVSANQNLDLLGEAPISVAPILNIPAAPASMVLTVDNSPQTVSFTFTPPDAGFIIVIEATAPVSAGRSFMPRSEYKRLAQLDDAETSPKTLTSEYAALYGTLPTGAKVFFRACTIDTNSGQQSPWIYGDSIVVA